MATRSPWSVSSNNLAGRGYLPGQVAVPGLRPPDIVNAVNTQNLTLPSGMAKMGDTQYTIRPNATPATIDDLNTMPAKLANGSPILLKDVARRDQRYVLRPVDELARRELQIGVNNSELNFAAEQHARDAGRLRAGIGVIQLARVALVEHIEMFG
jgi:hypothetical protein